MKTATTAYLTTCFSLFFSFGLATASDDTLRTVALSGNGAPGTSSGVNFAVFSVPAINDAGQTAFLGDLAGTGVNGSNDTGIWSEGGDAGLALVAREGDEAPGTSSGVNFSIFGTPAINDAGQAAFAGFLAGTGVVVGSNDTSIWSEGGDAGLALVAGAGNAVPGTSSGVNFLSLSFFPAINGAGQTAFVGSLTGTGVDFSNNRGIWSEGGVAGLALVARTGNAAPGTSSGVNFANFFSAAVLNGAGQTAFRGDLAGTEVDESNDTGIWSEGGNSGLALVAREGNAAPGTSSGVNFAHFFIAPAINDAGQTAFVGRLTGTEVDRSNNSGIWSEGEDAGLALVARTGNAAPGTNSGVNFAGFGPPVLNGAGQTAFFGALAGTGVDGSNNSGIWSEGGNSGLALVARAGNAAPGTSSGVNFLALASPVLNGAGQTAFFGFLTGTGVDGSNDFGFWAEDPLGALTLIAREGDQLDVDDGPGIDLRTISSLVGFQPGNESGNEDGRRSNFNDLGQLAFVATFTDGSSGVFVSDLAAQAIPEPSSIALMLSAVLGFSCVARRRVNLPRGTASCVALGLLILSSSQAHAVVVEGEFEAAMRSVPFFNSLRYVTTSNNSPSVVITGSSDLLSIPDSQPFVDFATLNPTISGTFAYDTNTIPNFSSSTYNNYDGLSLSSAANIPGVGLVAHLNDTPNVEIRNNDNGRDRFSINNFRNGVALDELNLSNPAPQSFVFDLLQDRGFTSNATSLPSLTEMPVRLTEPTVYEAGSFSLSLSDATSTVFSSTDLPTNLSLSDFTFSILHFDYLSPLDVTVDPADYATTADFLAASDYVTNNLSTVQVQWTANADITSFVASSVIPEPSSIALMISAFLGMACVARRRVNLPRGLASHS